MSFKNPDRLKKKKKPVYKIKDKSETPNGKDTVKGKKSKSNKK